MVQFSDIIADRDERIHECKQGAPLFDQHTVSRLLADREGAAFWNGLQMLAPEPAAVASGDEGRATPVSEREAGGNCGEDEDLISGVAEGDGAVALAERGANAGSEENGSPGSFLHTGVLNQLQQGPGSPDRLLHLAPSPTKPSPKPTPIATVKLPYRFYVIEFPRGIEVSANQGSADQNERRQEKYAERVAEKGGHIRQVVDIEMVYRRTDKQPKRDQMLKTKKGELRDEYLSHLPEAEQQRLRKLAEAPAPPRTPREAPAVSPRRGKRASGGSPQVSAGEGGLDNFSLGPPLQPELGTGRDVPQPNGVQSQRTEPPRMIPLPDLNGGPGDEARAGSAGEEPWAGFPPVQHALELGRVAGAVPPDVVSQQIAVSPGQPSLPRGPSAAALPGLTAGVTVIRQQPETIEVRPQGGDGVPAEMHGSGGADAPPVLPPRVPDAHPGMLLSGPNVYYQSKKKRSKPRKREVQDGGTLSRTAPMTYLLKLKRSVTDRSQWELLPPEPGPPSPPAPSADMAGPSTSAKSESAPPLLPQGGNQWEPPQGVKKVRTKGKKKKRGLDPETGLFAQSSKRKRTPRDYVEGEPRRKVGRPPGKRSMSPAEGGVNVGVLALGAAEGPDESWDGYEEEYEDLEGPCSAVLLLKEGGEGLGDDVIVEEQEDGAGGWRLAVLRGGEVVKTYLPERYGPEGRIVPMTGAVVWSASEKPEGPHWSLVFNARIDWHRFKDLHDQVLVKVRKAARSKKIPIPGVVEVENYEANYPPGADVRGEGAYIKHAEDDASLARKSATVLYDADSEDEEWLEEVNRASAASGFVAAPVSEDWLGGVGAEVRPPSVVLEGGSGETDDLVGGDAVLGEMMGCLLWDTGQESAPGNDAEGADRTVSSEVMPGVGTGNQVEGAGAELGALASSIGGCDTAPPERAELAGVSGLVSSEAPADTGHLESLEKIERMSAEEQTAGAEVAVGERLLADKKPDALSAEGLSTEAAPSAPVPHIDAPPLAIAQSGGPVEGQFDVEIAPAGEQQPVEQGLNPKGLVGGGAGGQEAAAEERPPAGQGPQVSKLEGLVDGGADGRSTAAGGPFPPASQGLLVPKSEGPVEGGPGAEKAAAEERSPAERGLVEEDWEALSLQPCSQAIDVDTLERIVDKLEKASALAGVVVSKQEGYRACEGLAPGDLVRTVYAHWRGRRQKLGKALIRYFQPTPWSRYQQLVKEWQESEAARRAACQREGRPFVATKKPPLDAFSLRPTSYSKEQRRLQRKTGNSPGRPRTSLKRRFGKKAVRGKASSAASASRLGPLWSPQYRPLGSLHTPSPGREFTPVSGGEFGVGDEGGQGEGYMEEEGLGFDDYLAHEATRKRSALGPLGPSKRSRLADPFASEVPSEGLYQAPWSPEALSGSSAARKMARSMPGGVGIKARTAAARAAKAAKQAALRAAQGKFPRHFPTDGRRPRKRKRIQTYSPKKETIAQIAARAVAHARELRTHAQFMAAVADAAMIRAAHALAECQELYEKELAARAAPTTEPPPPPAEPSVEQKSLPQAKGRGRGGSAKGARGRPKSGQASGGAPAETAALGGPVEGAEEGGGESGRPKGLHVDVGSGDEMEEDELDRELVVLTTPADIRSAEELAGIPEADGIPDALLGGAEKAANEGAEAHAAYSLEAADPLLSIDLPALLERERQLWKEKRVWGQDIGQQGLDIWPMEELEAASRLNMEGGGSRDGAGARARRKGTGACSVSALSLDDDEDDVDFDPVHGPFFEGYKVSRPRPRDLRVDVEGLDSYRMGEGPQTLASVSNIAGSGLMTSPKGRPGRKKGRATPRQ
ncbi:hypothetical protein KFL_005270040 [Klebsormidium nitens]|uniref:Enhancer of polycomb-like protein n=1 Tax=Klebsormidium nitens TaxID=105231 RepID=A0A1Y1IHC6_KLENI|nr:hypothetical protein KFL_005270040 [Klebsormidium nitens]|eukprot:GAQ89472.1 hypothetical protein KFL_005270040 [Klebsormidium nitens]